MTSPPDAPPQPGTAAPRSALPLRAHALAAVAACALDPARPAPTEAPELLYLRAQLAAVAPDGAPWSAALPAALRAPAPEDRPLFQLARALDLTALELLTVALAAAVEDEPLVGRALAHLQAPVGGSRPTLGLLAAALAETVAPGARPMDALVTGNAVRSGLLALLGDHLPLPERAVAVPIHLALAFAGHDGFVPGATLGLGDLPEIPLPPSIRREIERHARALRGGAAPALVIRTASVAEGRSVAALLAGALGLRPLFIETDKLPGLGPWLLLLGLLPVFCFDLGPGERKVLPIPPAYRGPVLALAGPDGSLAHPAGAALSWTLPVPPPEERRALWQLALDEPALAAALAHDHRHGSGRIAQLGKLARHQGALDGRERPTAADIAAAAWVAEGSGLDGLAQPLTAPIPDEALVVAPEIRAELEALVLRCRARDGLVHGLGASATARYSPGVRCLFVGPSGTGKTLAAGWLASRLGLPLYRVDLAGVTSKYIGETEKNLAQILARAEQAEILLLFDEADSLFGKRTDVKEANDRFANAQTNYLLQRIEAFEGIAVLTSNSKGRFDSAFSRRLDAIIELPLPGPEERRALWLSHLGARHRLGPSEINQLAVVVDLGGGHIRNAVLTAAVLASSEGRPLEHADILRGVAGEYRKLGRQMPGELKRQG